LALALLVVPFLLDVRPAADPFGSALGLVAVLLCILCYALGLALRVWARRYIGEHTRGSVHDADTLVTDGPYAYLRHPLYVSNTAFACGLVLLWLGIAPLAAPFVVVVVLFEVALSHAEDRFLEGRFGDAWRAWAKETPPFIPRLSGLVGGGRKAERAGSHRHLAKRTVWEAFAADASTWAWLLFINFLVLCLRFWI
jgi:protein-S-isoprenylcysteine O-methyltransferase Ste14